MDDLSYYAIAFLCACDKHLTTYETLGLWLHNLLQYGDSWDVFLNFEMEVVELAVEVKTATMDIPFKLHHLQ